MFDWFRRRLLTVHDIGRMHGKRGYPRADAAIAMPLYAVEPLGGEAVRPEPATDSWRDRPLELVPALPRAGDGQ